jgi:glycosyltransferase involved in cell wall biosynthesis
MKILYYSAHPYLNLAAPSGPGTHMREVIKAFENRGHQVIKLIAGGELLSGNNAIQFKKKNIKAFIPPFIWQSLKDYKLLKHDSMMCHQLADLIKREKPDFVYERGYYLLTSGTKICKELGVRHFIEINAPYPEEKRMMEGNSWFINKAQLAEKTQVNLCDRVFVVSTALKDYLQKNSGCDANKIIITPNAVNPEYISTDETKLRELRKNIKILKDEKVIGFVGSIFPYHGVDALLEAFKKIVEKSGRRDLKLLIVGDGEILPDLKKQVSTFNLEHQVIFTGNVPHNEVYNYISLMHITVMARSNWYGSPVKIFEYAALNKVVVAPDTIPVHDVMVNNVDGIILKNDKEDLERALTFILDHPEDAEKMSMSFHQKVMSRHTWQNVGDIILNEIK